MYNRIFTLDELIKTEVKVAKKCVEAKGCCSHKPDTCPSINKGTSCVYFKKLSL